MKEGNTLREKQSSPKQILVVDPGRKVRYASGICV